MPKLYLGKRITIKALIKFVGLNIIEHLWEKLVRKLFKSSISTVKQLKQGIRQEWNNITQEFYAHFVQSLPLGLETVKKQKLLVPSVKTMSFIGLQ